AEDGQFFRPDDHVQRLRRSLREIRLDGVDVDGLRDALDELLVRNDLTTGHAKTYLQITRGAAPRQHAFPDADTEPTVYARAEALTLPTEKWEEGVKVILHPDQRWARCDIKSLNYLPNVLANQAAMEADAYEALLTREGFVMEGSHSSMAAVFDGTVVTRPLTNHILPSTTRTVLLELCDDLGVPVEEAPIPTADLPDADELILLGTTTGIMPIVQVEDWAVGDGTPGPVTRKLQTAFRALEPA
ncbi:MAG TPA: aminotransferase class IV, partial [Salinibacter sp.]|nr:aminotransferase class IV [Salinibacter sp.]